MKDYKELLTGILFAIVGGILVYLIILADWDFLEMSNYLTIIIGAITGVLLPLVIQTLVTRKLSERRENGIYKLEKWIKYDKKRAEIEHQMDALYKQLVKSDMSRYIDMNRLIFDGQSSFSEQQLVDYNAFLQQFGLETSKMEYRDNSAIFLTPFNEEGDNLYKECREILSDAGIFLQRSDNYVEKDDILMNVVSLIVQSEIVLANIDGRNPNVYYELGIAHALGKPTILLSKREAENEKSEDIAFDIRQKRIILYETSSDLKTKLLQQITMLRKKVCDSKIPAKHLLSIPITN